MNPTAEITVTITDTTVLCFEHPAQFLREVFAHDALAAIRLAHSWGGFEMRVSNNMYGAAWNFIEEIDGHELLIRCQCCRWPVFDDEPHEFCNSDECPICGTVTAPCNYCGEVVDVWSLAPDGLCPDCKPCPGCGEIDPESNCTIPEEDDMPTTGQIRSNAWAAGMREDELYEAMWLFPGDFV